MSFICMGSELSCIPVPEIFLKPFSLFFKSYNIASKVSKEGVVIFFVCKLSDTLNGNYLTVLGIFLNDSRKCDGTITKVMRLNDFNDSFEI